MAFISCTAVFIFHWYLVFTMRESDDFSSLSGVNGLPRAPCTTLSQSEPDESWRCHLAISSLHEGRKTTLMEESIFFKCWIWSGLTEATQAYKPAPQACTGGTMMGAPPYPPLFLPSYAHQEQNSSENTTFFLQHPVPSSFSLPN